MGVVVRRRLRALAPLLCVAAWASPFPPSIQAAEPRPVWVGTGSCAATACHGGRREPLDLKGSEYGFSGAYDPHGRAYQVLFDDRSKTIEKNLKRLASPDVARPFENDLCLSCHVHQDFDAKRPQRSAMFALEDGVGCEGCHGAAGKWLVPHTEAWFKTLTDGQKSLEFGLTPTKDLLARGRNCAECHVGIGKTEVNHDLVAAGHPRLAFEYGGQLAKLPKHWRIADDKARHPDYEAKVWVLGQILSAQASLDLLGSRALRSLADESVPWPEFAEYSCFACHHELTKSSWRQAGGPGPDRPGSIPWGTWYLPMTRVAGASGLDSDSPGSPLGALRNQMARPSPDAALVARRTRTAAIELGRLADEINRGFIPPGQARSMLAKALQPVDDGRPLDWDLAAQKYLAIVALDKALGEFDPRYSDPAVRRGLKTLQDRLNLPMRVDRKGGIFDSPYRYDPARVVGDLRGLRSALPQP